MDHKTVLRIKSTVALVYKESKLDIFFANTREQFVIEIAYQKIVELLFRFDGIESLGEIAKRYPDIEYEELEQLVSYLKRKRVLIEIDADYDVTQVVESYRLICILEDFYHSTSEVVDALKMLSSKSVMIVGLGAVGTWITDSLARTGVNHFTLVDDDHVEISNLHRQDLFFEEDVGKSKVDVIHEKLLTINPKINVTKIKAKLDDNFFQKHNVSYDVIINCADSPSVDITTNIIAKESMKRNLPHIVGGGYNLHLTLIGQTVIPHVTACVKCFETHLEKINNADLEGVKKIVRPNRKIGSFAPLCALSASLATLDIVKVLIGRYEFINNANKRTEFVIENRDLTQHEVPKDPNCFWCGSNGIYKLK